MESAYSGDGYADQSYAGVAGQIENFGYGIAGIGAGLLFSGIVLVFFAKKLKSIGGPK